MAFSKSSFFQPHPRPRPILGAGSLRKSDDLAGFARQIITFSLFFKTMGASTSDFEKPMVLAAMGLCDNEKNMLAKLKSRARSLKAETYAIYIAARDPRTPWFAKILILSVVAYALSPIDLIPDFIPVLGYLDDLVIVPAGLALALRMIPPEVMQQARVSALNPAPSRTVGIVGAGIIALIWILAIIVLAPLIIQLFRKTP